MGPTQSSWSESLNRGLVRLLFKKVSRWLLFIQERKIIGMNYEHCPQIHAKPCALASRPLIWLQAVLHARLPCPSPTPGACSNSYPSSWWCHPNISPSVVPFSSCLQSFPALRSFPMSQFFTSGGQSIGTSASASVLPMNTQDRSPLGWTGWISLQSKGLSRVFLRIELESINSLVFSLLYGPTLTSIHDYWKSYSFNYMAL